MFCVKIKIRNWGIIMERDLIFEILRILLKKGELSDSDISHIIYGNQGSAALPIMNVLSRMELDGLVRKLVKKNGGKYVIADYCKRTK